MVLLVPGTKLELSDREKFCSYWGEKFGSKLYVPLYVLYNKTSPQVENWEK